MLKQNSSLFLAVLVFLDLVFLIASFIISKYIVFGSILFWQLKELIVSSVIILLLYFIIEKNEFTHTYRFRPFGLIIKNLIIFQIILYSFFYISNIFNIYRFNDKQILYFSLITFSIFLTERLFIKMILSILRRKGYNFRRYLIIGAGQVGLNFYRKIVSNPELGIRIIGFLDDNEEILKTDNPEYTDTIKSLILGTTDKIELILKSFIIDNVIVALPMRAEQKIVDITNICEKYGVKAELIPDYFKIISVNPFMRQIEGYPLIGIRNVPLENMFNRFIKRLFDIVFSLIGLIVLSPVFLVITILIKAISKGPVFFTQKRTGYKQREFKIYKFRTMIVNEESDVKQATKDDPRKTKIGDFLRKYNLDELPQLFNILKGDMSIVGPRPHMLLHTEEFYKKYDKYHIRHWVKPGLTGWAQVNGWRGDSDIGMRVKYDIEYIENWSFFFDIKIIFLTIFGKKVKRYAY